MMPPEIKFITWSNEFHGLYPDNGDRVILRPPEVSITFINGNVIDFIQGHEPDWLKNLWLKYNPETVDCEWEEVKPKQIGR